MQYQDLHSWDVTPEEARHIQNGLRTQVIQMDRFGTIRTVAGMDIGFRNETARASVVVLSFPDLQLVECVVAESPICFPYIPGLLSFREVPPLLAAFTRLQTEPDLVIADGQGIAHPRRFGLASHLGLVLDKPTIGCAKSRLWGRYTEPDTEQGAYTYLTDKEDVIGAAVRTRTNVSVVYVSIGHRISLDSARTLVLACCQGYRLPETTRYAHNAASGKIPERTPSVSET